MKLNKDGEKKRKPKTLVFILLLLSSFCFVYYFAYIQHQQELAYVRSACVPVSTTGEEKELSLSSTIVQDLYSKVRTNIREDIASPIFDNKMKLYLAYRQIPTSKIYQSNCNLFSQTDMNPFICKESQDYIPTAFKEETLQLEVKKLFGELQDIANANIQLGNSCIGGYQYIAERGEYVSGYCKEVATTIFKVNKELVQATSRKSVIQLKEDVKYYGAEGKDLPASLKSGRYIYTFKLDTNYNYVLISKELEK